MVFRVEQKYHVQHNLLLSHVIVSATFVCTLKIVEAKLLPANSLIVTARVPHKA